MKSTYTLDNGVYIKSSGTVVGPLEKQGQLGDYYDKSYDDSYCGEKSWEKAEMRLLRDAIDLTMESGNLKPEDVNAILAGDLINQEVISNYTMRNLDVPFLGMYGACSTSMETLLTASLLVNSGQFKTAIAATSSHNKTAERQYRYPVEYGNKKPATATFTITGAGACSVSQEKSDIKVTSVTIGRVIDAKEKNPNDMGCAMAPAASDTIIRHLEELGVKADHYDMIVTGDLSEFGSKVLVDILKDQNIDLTHIHNDCGNMIFTPEQKKTVRAGGSGCACSAVVTYGYLLDLLRKQELKRILVVATGALLNPVMTLQGDSIPCIAHAVALERVM
jgi:stage V sporulation protein AD